MNPGSSQRAVQVTKDISGNMWIQRIPKIQSSSLPEGLTACLQRNGNLRPYATALVKHHVCTPTRETAFEKEKSGTGRITTQKEAPMY